MNRPNILLVVLAAVSVAFGLYGFLFGGVAAPADSQRAANSAGVADLDRPARTEPARRPANSPARPEDTHAAVVPTNTIPDTPPEPEAVIRPKPRGDGAIEGVVADPAGTPLQGVTIFARDRHSESYGRMTPETARKQLDRILRETFSASSDAEGKFRIEGLARGEYYRITASSERWGDLQNMATPGERLYLQFADTPTTMGTVEDETGAAVEGFAIAWKSTDGDFSSGNRTYGGSFIARWENEAAGFRIQCTGFEPSALMEESFKGRSDVKVLLRKAPRLEVVVASPTGEPVPRVEVRVTQARIAGAEVEPRELDTTQLTTDMRGCAVFNTLPAGEYELTCTLGNDHSATVNVALEKDARADVVLDPGFALTVRVLSADDKPVAGSGVSIRDAAGEWLSAQEVETGLPGETKLIGLPAALIQVQVNAVNFPVQWIDVDLSSGSQAIEVRLRPGGIVKGKVTDGSGNALEGILLKLVPPGGAEKGRFTTSYTGRGGEYKTEPLQPGTWVVELYRDWMGEHLLNASVTVAEGETVQDFVVDNLCVLHVVVESEGTLHDWVSLWLLPDGSDEPRQEWIPEEDKHEKNFSLKPGTYLVSANTDDLAAPAREVTIASGVTSLVLRLGRPNALRFRWVEAGSEISKAGVKFGDLLIEYNGQPVTSKADLNRLVEQAGDQQEVAAVILHGRTRVEVKLPKTPFQYWLEPAAR